MILNGRIHGESSPSIKKDFGHDLQKLNSKLQKICEENKVTFGKLFESEPVYGNILEILSDFAKCDRYSNIDLLLGKTTNDLTERWFKEVDLYILEYYISDKKKAKIACNAQIIEHIMGSTTDVSHYGEDLKTFTDVMDGSARTGIFEAAAPYRQLFILQIIRCWSSVLSQLGDILRKDADIPYFNEILRDFLIPDEYLKSKKNWDEAIY